MSKTYPVYGRIAGPIVMIGFGSIGRGTLPLIERHFDYDKSQLTVIEPEPTYAEFLKARGIQVIQQEVTKDNYQNLLSSLFKGKPQGFCVNLSVDTSSVDLMRFCREMNTLYIDTVVEPWPGFYFGGSVQNNARTNYALRETVLAERRRSPGGTTAVSCCGANPGMVSWFVKEALLTIAKDTGINAPMPTSKEGWAKLMQKAGVKGIHIAERDTQRSSDPKRINTFVNTWSVEGFVSEGFQPAELGWGTHEKWMPPGAQTQNDPSGCQAAIFLNRPGADTRVRTWCPTPGSQYGFLVTHNESVSIADYFTVGSGLTPEYRPTCHYAYHPCNDAILSFHEAFGAGKVQEEHRILDENEIIDGMDELGVLLYGHAKNAYWFGSRLTIEQTRALAPYQNATGLQVTSAVLAGMVWALENPNAGIVEADDLDHVRCLEVQKPYLGNVEGHYTDWTPLSNRWNLFDEDIDASDPWQFKNVLVS